MSGAMEMPRYRCHKEVHALKIASAARVTPGADIELTFEDAGFGSMIVDAALGSRYFPAPGDYLVTYADGYMAFSPGKAFEDGYVRIE